MSAVPVIAIDGPSSSGKGTVASLVAGRLGFHLLESGALYRLVALASAREDIPVDHEPRLAAIATRLEASFEGGRILLRGEDVSEAIRGESCGMRASAIASYPFVRKALLDRQRGFRQAPGLVADGRDMGTVVFPDAKLKVFLTASLAERTARRHKQLKEKGIDANLAALSRDLEERDARDATRAVAPLAPAADAVQLDSSGLPIDEVVARVVGWYQEKMKENRQ